MFWLRERPAELIQRGGGKRPDETRQPTGSARYTPAGEGANSGGNIRKMRGISLKPLHSRGFCLCCLPKVTPHTMSTCRRWVFQHLFHAKGAFQTMSSFMDSAKSFFASESVTEGHPDKLCDQISDGVLDAILAQDPYARVACEAATTTGLVLIAGEISTSAWVDMPAIVRKTIEQVGYINADYGFDYRTCGVVTSIGKQSPDIDMGVSHSLETKGGVAILSDDEL